MDETHDKGPHSNRAEDKQKMNQYRNRNFRHKQTLNSGRALDIYENIIIGNFLFGLGVKLGMQHHAFPVEPTSVNLLQQQNLDGRLGDVMIANARVIRLIEFKRVSNKDAKEIEKWSLVNMALKGKGFSSLYDVSRRIHWYVDSEFGSSKLQNKNNKIGVQSYLDFPIMNRYAIGIAEFIDKIARESSEGVCEEEFVWCQMYVEMIASLFGEASGFSGCLLLTVSGSGQLSYVAVDDIGDLLKTPRLAVQRHLERHVQLVRERELTQEQELERQRTREHQIEREGPSLSY